MIEVELHRVPEGTDEYQAVARLTVADDGTTSTWDPHGFLPLDLPVLVADGRPGPPRRVSFEEDPATYARKLKTILRTGYLVPVITKDTGIPA